MTLRAVTVLHRTGQWCPGVRTADGALAYDMEILPPWQVPGKPTRDRSYVIGSAGVQLTRPVNFVEQLEGGWYIDLVDLIDLGDDRYEVRDLYLDFVVPPTGRRYEVLDLDELADAMVDGTLAPRQVASVLRNAQQFIDRHLRDLASVEPAQFPDFPPTVILPLIDLPPFPAIPSPPDRST